uniref:Uncharacterized protein n=1 Tax=Anopheles maculatus TaxID=74869 RepID=A0A182SWI9_9DIPT
MKSNITFHLFIYFACILDLFLISVFFLLLLQNFVRASYDTFGLRMTFQLTKAYLRQLWLDLESGRPGDCTFLMDDGTNLEMDLYVMSIYSPNLYAVVNEVGTLGQRSIQVRVRYIGYEHLQLLRRYIYIGMVTVIPSALFSFLADGILLEVFNLRVMERACFFYTCYTHSFLVYRKDMNDTLVIPASHIGCKQLKWDMNYESLPNGHAVADKYMNAGVHGIVSARAQPPPYEKPLTVYTEEENGLFWDVLATETTSRSSSEADDANNDNNASSGDDDSDPTLDRPDSNESSEAYYSTSSSPIVFDSYMRQYLEELIEPSTSEEDSSSSGSENVITAKLNVQAIPDAIQDTDVSEDDQMTEEDFITDDSSVGSGPVSPALEEQLEPMDCSSPTENRAPAPSAVIIYNVTVSSDIGKQSELQVSSGVQKCMERECTAQDATDAFQSSANADNTPDKNRNQQARPAPGNADGGNAAENNCNTPGTVADGNNSRKRATEDLMYARRSLPLPYIQGTMSDFSDPYMSDVSDDSLPDCNEKPQSLSPIREKSCPLTGEKFLSDISDDSDDDL